jgi:hypothetical protein
MGRSKNPPDPWAEELKIKLPKSKKLSREKGHSFERAIANEFKKVFPGAKRHLEYQTVSAALGIDIVDTGDYRVQCKRLALYANPSRIFEIRIDPERDGPDLTRILVTKADRMPTLAVLPFEKLMQLIEFHERYKGIEQPRFRNNAKRELEAAKFLMSAE